MQHIRILIIHPCIIESSRYYYFVACAVGYGTSGSLCLSKCSTLCFYSPLDLVSTYLIQKKWIGWVEISQAITSSPPSSCTTVYCKKCLARKLSMKIGNVSKKKKKKKNNQQNLLNRILLHLKL